MQPSPLIVLRVWRLLFLVLGASFTFLVLFSPVSAIDIDPEAPSSKDQPQVNTELKIGIPVIFNNIRVSPPSPGILLITEILYNPAGREPQGEWVELYNAGGSPIDLYGYKIGDQSSPGCCEGMLAFPAGAVLHPGEVIIVAYQASAFEAVYRFKPDYEMESSDPAVPVLTRYTAWAERSVELTNTGDELLVLGPSDQDIDQVSWGSSTFAFDPPVANVQEGYSLERYPPYRDTNTAQDWRKQSLPQPGEVDWTTPTATPGPPPLPTLVTPDPATPMPTPFGGKLLLSEFLYDPEDVEPGGEWIEIYNADTVPFRLEDFKLGDEETPGGSEGMLHFPAGALLNAGQTAVVAHQGNAFLYRYGFLPDYEIFDTRWDLPDLLPYPTWGSAALSLHNEGDELLLLDGLDQLVDGVSYGSSTFFFSPSLALSISGCSLERYPSDLDSGTASDWRQQCQPSPGDPAMLPVPTPVTPTPAPQLVFNEIHHAPDSRVGDANGDGVVSTQEDEFVEIINLTGVPVNLAGWCLSDSLACRHIFPSPSWIRDECSVVIFAYGDPTGDFGSSLVQVSSSHTLSLGDASDTLILTDPEGAQVLRLTYDPGGVTGESLALYPEISGSDWIPHTTAPEALGALFSPGTRLDASPFQGCSTED